MKYTYNEKTYTIDDAWIEDTTKKLDITKEEAIDMWLCDNDVTLNEEQEELTEKAKSQPRRYERSTVKNKKTVKVRKKDEVKQEIIVNIAEKLREMAQVEQVIVTNDEKYIDFLVKGENFTINLVKHRKK